MPVEKSMYYLTHLSCHLANSYKMVSIKYTCFQLMCQGGEIQFDSILKSLVHFEATDDLSLQSFIIYGKNGFKTKHEYFPGIDVNIFGSIHCKLLHSNGNKVSIIFFRSGKIKIAGGLINLKDDCYIRSITDSVCSIFTGSPCSFFKISLLNAIFRISMNPRIFRKFIFDLQETGSFHRIKEPTLTGRGNITCARVYPFNNRKSHLSVDPKGAIQMFAFQSFHEIDSVASSFFASSSSLLPLT